MALTKEDLLEIVGALKEVLRPEPVVLKNDTIVSPDDVYRASNPLDEMSDEEIQYYATPYYDELQEKKRSYEEAIKSEIRE